MPGQFTFFRTEVGIRFSLHMKVSTAGYTSPEFSTAFFAAIISPVCFDGFDDAAAITAP